MLFPDNEGEDKHVESKLIPRLDESSNLSISTKACKSLIFRPLLIKLEP
nr:MAG TPA: hypothetical protein [Caudoviricetes sp.]